MLGAYDDLEALAEVCSKHKVTNIPQIDTQSIAMHLFPWIGPRVLVNLIFRFGCMWTLAGEGQQFFQGTQSSYKFITHQRILKVSTLCFRKYKHLMRGSDKVGQLQLNISSL